MTEPVTLRCANYAFICQWQPLPDAIRHHARRAIVDWFAALIRGGSEVPAKLIRQAFADDLGKGQSVLYPDGIRSNTRNAALLNGTAAHTLETDDIFKPGVYHPGCPVIAAALAVAQSRGADGERLLRGIVSGYEISTRISAAMAPAHYRFWHPTGTVGTLGAAVAASTIMELSAPQTAHALATAATFAAALQQAFRCDTMSKPLHAGRAAEAGVTAALLAAQGVTGALDILEGEAGFGAAMANKPDWARAFSDLGQKYTITQMTFKNHACCGHCFAAIDAALALGKKYALQPENIRRIQVETYQVALDVCGRETVATPFHARFSLRYGIAHALLHGRVRLAAFAPDRIAEIVVHPLFDRIGLAVEATLTAAFPTQRAARMTIETNDGQVLHHFQPNRRGDPEQPLSDSELNDKFSELVEPVLGDAATAKLLDSLWRIDQLDAGAVRSLGSHAEQPSLPPVA